jgi:hypothetical protein
VLESPAQLKDEQRMDGSGFEAQRQDVRGMRGEREAQGDAETEEKEESHEEESRAEEKGPGPQEGEEEVRPKTFYYRCYRRGSASAFFLRRRGGVFP